MARDDPQMKLRMPPELRDRIADAAYLSKRSLNAEIVARLEASFSLPLRDEFKATAIDQELTAVVKQLALEVVRLGGLNQELIERLEHSDNKKLR